MLDLVAWGAGMPDVVIEVIVRHPAAATYAEAEAADVPVTCVERAEADKARRYPARGGVSVWPFAAETWGRVGLQAE